jgi:hypothetical protein
MRIGAYVLAIVLLGAAAGRASFAEEQSADTRSVAGSSLRGESSGDRALSRASDRHPAAGSGVAPKSDGNSDVKQGQAIRGETAHQGHARAGPKGGAITGPNGVEEHSVAKDFRSSPSGGRDVDGIDTRITVLPHRPDRKSDTVRDTKTKFKLGVPASVRGRPLLHPGVPALAARNAIALPVAARTDLPRPSGEPRGLSEQSSKPSGLNPGRRRVGLSQIGPDASVAAYKSGKINGTGLIRPGTAPSGIGGPARSTAGINGTTITSKH